MCKEEKRKEEKRKGLMLDRRHDFTFTNARCKNFGIFSTSARGSCRMKKMKK